ncbi:MAG: O-antigen ligase family protein [Nitrospirota bacterium]
MNNIVGKIKFFSVAKVLFYLFFAFLPFQVDALLVVQDVYSSGFFNPYTSFFVYITDVFLVLSLIFLSLSVVFKEGKFEKLNFIKKKSGLIMVLVIGIFLLLNIVSLVASVDHINTLVSLLRLFQFVVVFFLIKSGFVDVKKLMYVFIGVISFVAFIGIFQYMFQESLGLRFLGEPVISSDKLGVAKVGLDSGNFLRIYGTFPHPNIFAGYLCFAIFFIIYCFRDAKVLFSLLTTVCLIALVLTFSRSALLALFIGLFLYYAVSNVKITWKNVMVGLVFVMFFFVVFDLYSVLVERLIVGDQSALTERTLYYSASKQMFFDNLFGVGLGNFTSIMQQYLSVKLQPWLIQPVHNIFLLMFNEIGLLGGLGFIGLFGFFFSRLIERKSRFSYIMMSIWAVIVVIGLFDHYFVSLYQGNVMLWMYFGLVGTLD